MKHPVIDLHCDLLGHMLNMPNPDPFQREGIGCSFPALAEGHVKLQVMAIFTATEKGSTALAVRQSEIFASFLAKYPNHCTLIHDLSTLNQIATSSKLGMIAAIENASGFCEEDEPLDIGLERLEQIIANTTRILYIGFTHHAENRFGGGNNSQVGLKEDGKRLLQYLNGRKIAVDFSHTSDALAKDILDYISKHHLEVPILASHSNYRQVFNHARNLPDDIAKEIIQRGGIIGVNFLRAFVNNEDSNALYQHINHGIKLGGSKAICFGADYFSTSTNPDQSRIPFYFKEHEDASRYPSILQSISQQVSPDIIEDISSENVIRYLTELWK
ncbi:dipeptidase [Bizionia arctica]|uniref:Dipeptidase n=1 Tax=Bizionia arctica TaxID=1495645 RepID=A0A917GBR7_9FLAO|nr:membrane dipeptidase [Bizionia arctica]GGG35654.1 dipeptidase [Bizionia arctica]